jgi:hypothetical protein
MIRWMHQIPRAYPWTVGRGAQLVATDRAYFTAAKSK